MSFASHFRLSTFLTLAFAVSSLGFAETSLFPEVGFFAAFVVICLLAIYLTDARIERVTLTDANKLGAGIALISTGWVAYRVLREIRLGEFSEMGWQAMGMALFGAVLMLLIPAKLLRSEKHTGDWWTLHAMGLACVALAAAMTNEAAVFLLITSYAACGVWSLTEFTRERYAGGIEPIPAAITSPPTPHIVASHHHSGIGFTHCLFWVVAAASLALPLFLITPRSTAGRFEFGKPRIEMGFAADQMINLKRTGELEESPEPAFEVRALQRNGTPITNLNPNTRWRGITLNRYDSGSWSPERYRIPPAATGIVPPHTSERWEPPNLGPTMFHLTFTLFTQDGSYFLADPVTWVAGQSSPVATLCPQGPVGWASAHDGSGTFLRARCGKVGMGGTATPYVQFAATPAEPDLGPGFEFAFNSGAYLQQIVENYPPRVKEFADDLLTRLIHEGRLPAEASGRANRGRRGRNPVRLLPPRQYHEVIAREFSRYLADSPEFTYTSNLQRLHPNEDPIVEFLFEQKSGHCERYAAALAMMLRSQGIPSVLVLGFRGCEHQGGGKYVVRQSDAHTWVETLIMRPKSKTATVNGPAEYTWHWLSLDPTPSRLADDDRNDQAGGPLGHAYNTVRDFFEDYVLNYTSARREKAVTLLTQLVRSRITWGVALLILCGVAFTLFRRPPRPPAAPVSEPARWFAQMPAALATYGFVLRDGATPREFAQEVAAALAQHATAHPFAEVPGEWVEAYYCVRFGDTPLTPERHRELRSQLEALTKAL